MTIGTRVKVAECGLVDSGKLGTVTTILEIGNSATRQLAMKLGWTPVLIDGEKTATAFPEVLLEEVQ